MATRNWRMARQPRRCPWCDAHLIWPRTTNGGTLPVDWARHPDGNVLLIHEPADTVPLAIVVGPRDTLSVAGQALPRHMAHLTTCPEADEWRRTP